MEKLDKGRIDLWYTSYGTMAASALARSLDPNAIHEVLVVKHDDVCIAFNRNFSKALSKKWQNVYRSFYEQGKIKEIYQKRHEEYLFPKTLSGD